MKVYAVVNECGAYSDFTSTVEAILSTEELAKEYVDRQVAKDTEKEKAEAVENGLDPYEYDNVWSEWRGNFRVKDEYEMPTYTVIEYVVDAV